MINDKDDPPPEFVLDIAHFMLALEKEGLAELRIGPGGQLEFRLTARFTEKAARAVEAALHRTDGGALQ